MGIILLFNMTNSYTLGADPHFQGYEVLLKDGRPVNCPFHPPVQVQGTLAGQSSLIYRPCGNWCALFNQSNDTAVQNCGNGKLINLKKDEPKMIGL